MDPNSQSLLCRPYGVVLRSGRPVQWFRRTSEVAFWPCIVCVEGVVEEVEKADEVGRSVVVVVVAVVVVRMLSKLCIGMYL